MSRVILQDKKICKEIISDLDSLLEKTNGAELVSRYLKGGPVNEDESSCLHDAVSEYFENYAETVASLSWDCFGMGHSGAMELVELGGVYMVKYPDVDDFGPYFNLEDALNALFANAEEVCNPSLTTYGLPDKKVLALAAGVVQDNDDETIYVNGKEYRKVKGKLVRVRE